MTALFIDYNNESNKPSGVRRLIVSLRRIDLNKKNENDTYTIERTYLGNITSRELIGRIVFNSINSLNISEKYSVSEDDTDKDKYMKKPSESNGAATL